jgi:uncharacterized protein YceK
MKKLIGIVVVIGLLLSISGCASMLKGTKGSVSFSSEPAGAKVLINGFQSGVTPCTIEMNSGNSYNVTMKKAGYDDGYYLIVSSFKSGWLFIDVLCGGFPAIFDAVTGSWNDLTPSAVKCYLEKEKTGQEK